MYRERQKTFEIINKPAPKTSAERGKAYRERQKIKKSEIALIIDEVSMMGAENLDRVDRRLRDITGRQDLIFGVVHVILLGDLRQLPPVQATSIWKQKQQKIGDRQLWRRLNYYELTEVMRQENELFSSALTTVGNGDILNTQRLQLIESRFVTREKTDRLCPQGIRLFFKNDDVDAYNNEIFSKCLDKIDSITDDTLLGCGDNWEKERAARLKLHQLQSNDTGGLPYLITCFEPTVHDYCEYRCC